MEPIQQTRHVLAVKDLEMAKAYYTQELGFKVEFEVEGWAFISLGSFHIMLGHCPDEVPAAETHNHAYFAYAECTDIDKLYAAYCKRNVEFAQAIADKSWGMREFAVRTPEGHRIMFGQDLD